MITHRTVRTVVLSSILALAVVMMAFLAVANPTHAAPAQKSIPTVKPQQSNITQTVMLAHYYPKTLSCTHHTGQTCISIKNTTTTTQSVTFNGKVVYTLKPGALQAITYSKKGTYVYSLTSNPHATLTVTVS